MDKNGEYKLIFILSSILVITTVIGEFSRISLKEGMNFGGLISKFLKLVICFFSFVLMNLMILLWLLQVAFTWFPFFLIWLLQFIICAFTKFLNIPNCFLWYGMEIAGKILYLPFRLTFYVLDLILSAVGVDMNIEKIVDQIWWFIDDIDHLMYDSGSGFHIVHYPEDVIKRCYTCKIDKLAPMPAFPMSAVNSFMRCIR
jgi:hypothetical protein